MANFLIKLHGLMVKAVDWYAKGPWIESWSRDQKINTFGEIFYFLSFLKKITFSTKNCHLSNTFWLYKLRVSSAQFMSKSNLNQKILNLDTL